MKMFKWFLGLATVVLGLSFAPEMIVGQDNDAPRTAAQRDDDSDEGFDLGWLGLLGLVGLAGLKRRDRDDHHRHGTATR